MKPTTTPQEGAAVPLVWHTEVRQLAELSPYEHNPRTISKSDFVKLKKSLKEDGYHARIAISPAGVIIAGHMRFKAMEELKWKEAEVLVPNRELTAEEFDRINIRDNISFGQFDLEVLGQRFEASYLVDLGLNIQIPTLNNAVPVEDPDEVMPEPPAEPISKSGDLYDIGLHRLMCGDATNTEHMRHLFGLSTWPEGQAPVDALADMIFTDPPYNVAYVGKTKDALTIQNDKMGNGDFYDFLLAAYKNMALSVKPGGAIYVAHADTEGENFRSAYRAAGFKLSGCLVWVKPSMVLGRSDYQWRHEPILYGWKEGAAHKWYSDRKQTTVWEFDRPSRSAEHPTMKPIALIENALTNSSEQGNLVLDSFGGSGSTMVACHKNGRVCNTMELDPKYCDVIVTRMLKLYPDLQGQLKRNGEAFVWSI